MGIHPAFRGQGAIPVHVHPQWLDKMVQQQICRPHIPSHPLAIGIVQAHIGKTTQVQCRIPSAKQQLVGQRHQWGALPPQGHIQAPKVMDHGRLENRMQSGATTQLQGPPMLRTMEHCVAMGRDEMGARVAAFAQPVENRLSRPARPFPIQSGQLLCRQFHRTPERGPQLGRVVQRRERFQLHIPLIGFW